MSDDEIHNYLMVIPAEGHYQIRQVLMELLRRIEILERASRDARDDGR